MKELVASADYGLVGLIFFFTFFVIVTFWTLRPGAKDSYVKYGHIPLEENE